MTTWTSISNAAVAVGGIPSSTTVTALRDNPSALAESASGAPVMVSGWHPHDKVSIGDGKTGLIYDFAVNGLAASVVTPDFVDGYEYRIIAHLMESNAAATVRLELEAFFATTAAYRRLIYTGDASSLTNQFGYDVEILVPRIPKKSHLVIGNGYVDENMESIGYDSTGYTATTQVLSRARVTFTSGSISAGKVWMFRRREYASSP
jgi:hypothetical protein